MKETVYEQIRPVRTPPIEGKDEYTKHSAEIPLPAAEWPTAPAPLSNTWMQSIMAVLYDIVLIAVPAALIVKIGLVIQAWRMDSDKIGVDVDQNVSQMTKYLVSFNGQLVTLFTIFFVSIVSTLVRRYALWKAQKGAFVSELEQLHGSISMISTLKLILSLRAFTLTSIGLVVVWAFYYLGSQASKLEYRLVSSEPLRQQNGAVIQPGAVSVFNSNNTQDHTLGPSAMYTMMTRAEDVYNVGLYSGEGVAYTISRGRNPPPFRGFDPDGFAVLPRFDCLLGRCNNVSETPDKDGWLSKTSSYYSSLVGYPIWTNNTRTVMGAPSQWLLSTTQLLGSYQASTSYIDVACGPLSLQSFDAFPNGTSYNQSMTINATRTLDPPVLDFKGKSLRVFDIWLRWIPDANNGRNESGSARWTCNITQVYGDMQVGCSAAGCIVQKFRLANNTSPQQAVSYSTSLDDDALASALIDTLLLFPAPQTDLSYASTMVNRMSYLFNTQFESLSDPFVATLIAARVNDVITRYVNAFHMLSQIDYDQPQFEQVIETGTDGNYQRINFRAAIYGPHYAISWPWIAVDFASCLILFTASVLAILMRIKTLAPDVLGSVSSMTRDNPFLHLPESGSTLGGVERSRMLRRVKVQLGDISDGQYDLGVGRIGLARVGNTPSRNTTARVEQLRKDIKYV